MTTKFMTNIDTRLYQFIQQESQKQSISKRELLENILQTYITLQEQENLKSQYASMGEDNEYLDEMQENTSYLGTL